MSSYIHFTEEQKQRAAAVDLEEFPAAVARSSSPPAEKNGWPATTASLSAATSGMITPRREAVMRSALFSASIVSATRKR